MALYRELGAANPWKLVRSVVRNRKLTDGAFVELCSGTCGPGTHVTLR
jgi:hypothetical protein